MTPENAAPRIPLPPRIHETDIPYVHHAHYFLEVVDMEDAFRKVDETLPMGEFIFLN